MIEWLDKPAGKHGWLKMDRDRMSFEDGTPAVFWGTNVTERNVHMGKTDTVAAGSQAKYGINAVRFHKFTWTQTGVVVSSGKTTELDPIKMDLMDEYFFELKQEGIHVVRSHIFGHMISKEDAPEKIGRAHV